MSLVRENLPTLAALCVQFGQPPYGRISKEGWFSFPCPNCGGTKCARGNDIRGSFVCMAACGFKGGDVIAFQMAMTGQQFVDACKALGAWQDDPRDAVAPRRRPMPFPARDALEILADEINLAAVAASNLAQGHALTDYDRQRLRLSAQRVRTIQEACA